MTFKINKNILFLIGSLVILGIIAGIVFYTTKNKQAVSMSENMDMDNQMQQHQMQQIPPQMHPSQMQPQQMHPQQMPPHQMQIPSGNIQVPPPRVMKEPSQMFKQYNIQDSVPYKGVPQYASPPNTGDMGISQGLSNDRPEYEYL